tara:strand:- start:53 stop:331 length:279 start_codon:yes stop_codon:yes gene_type:complete
MDEAIITLKEKINKNHLFSFGWLKLSENFFPFKNSALNKDKLKTISNNILSIDDIKDKKLWASYGSGLKPWVNILLNIDSDLISKEAPPLIL